MLNLGSLDKLILQEKVLAKSEQAWTQRITKQLAKISAGLCQGMDT